MGSQHADPDGYRVEMLCMNAGYWSMCQRVMVASMVLVMGTTVPWSSAVADENILVNPGGNLPGPTLGGLDAPDDDVFPPP